MEQLATGRDIWTPIAGEGSLRNAFQMSLLPFSVASSSEMSVTGFTTLATDASFS